MEIIKTKSHETLELRLRGRLDASWADHVGKAIDDAKTHEHSRVIDLEQLPVDMAQRVADRTRAPGFRAEQVRGQRHEQRRGHALV